MYSKGDTSDDLSESDHRKSPTFLRVGSSFMVSASMSIVK